MFYWSFNAVLVSVDFQLILYFLLGDLNSTKLVFETNNLFDCYLNGYFL